MRMKPALRSERDLAEKETSYSILSDAGIVMRERRVHYGKQYILQPYVGFAIPIAIVII